MLSLQKYKLLSECYNVTYYFAYRRQTTNKNSQKSLQCTFQVVMWLQGMVF